MNNSKPKLNHFELMKHSQLMRKLSTVKEREDDLIV